jgi:hypothetical protein
VRHHLLAVRASAPARPESVARSSLLRSPIEGPRSRRGRAGDGARGDAHGRCGAHVYSRSCVRSCARSTTRARLPMGVAARKRCAIVEEDRARRRRPSDAAGRRRGTTREDRSLVFKGNVALQQELFERARFLSLSRTVARYLRVTVALTTSPPRWRSNPRVAERTRVPGRRSWEPTPLRPRRML